MNIEYARFKIESAAIKRIILSLVAGLALILTVAACSNVYTSEGNSSDVDSSRIEVGDTAPTFDLPSVSHGNINLIDYKDDKPVVLVFYRAYWCSACRRQLNELNAHYEDFTEAGAEVIAITTDNLEPTRDLAKKAGYKFPVLYTSRDPSVPEAYGSFDNFGDGLASAAAFLINSEGEIVWEELGNNPYYFIKSNTIIEQLEKLPS